MNHLAPALGIGLSTVFALQATAQQSNRKKPVLPNIVIIYLDDMGYGDLTTTGATGYSTPNLDRLAGGGMLFTRYYAPQAVSSASRAGLLTGCYPNRIGMSGALDHTSKTGIAASEITLAELLKQKGYATAAFGKWHLGHHLPFLPLQNGFDEFYGIPYSHDMWPNHPTAINYYPPLPLIEGETVVETNPDHSRFTSGFTRKAITYIRKNAGNPFFIYLAHPMPHVPLAVSDKFRGKSAQGLYGDVMTEIDESVGEIVTTLRELKLEENTLLIFTSDNGPWINYGNHAGSTGGLREGKGTTYEGGQRVPCIMSWKGTIPAGVVCNKMVSGIDIFPTLAEITGAGMPAHKIDGVSILPLLQGNMDATPRKTFLYYYRSNSLEAVSNGDWKLVFPHPGRTYRGFLPGNDGMPGNTYDNYPHEGGLYDLRRDPGESYNVRFLYPGIAAELEKIAAEARQDLGDDLTGNPGTGRRKSGYFAVQP